MESEIITRLEKIERLTALSAKQMLTIEDLSVFTGFSKDYIYQLTSKKLIPYYKPQGKTVYFDKGEINEWMHQNRVAAIEEIERLNVIKNLSIEL